MRRIVIPRVVVRHGELGMEVCALDEEPRWRRRRQLSELIVVAIVAVGELFDDDDGVLVCLVLDEYVYAEEVIHPMVRDGSKHILHLLVDGRVVDA